MDELAAKPMDRALITAFLEMTPASKPIFDVGAGPGHVAEFARRLGGHAYALDQSALMLSQAKKRFPQVVPICGSMLALPLRERSVGGLLSFYSIIHFSDAQLAAAFGEFRRVLVPGGAVLVSFHVGDEDRHLATWFDESVDLTARLLPVDHVAGALTAAGLHVRASVHRNPYPEENATQRCYLIAVADPPPGDAPHL